MVCSSSSLGLGEIIGIKGIPRVSKGAAKEKYQDCKLLSQSQHQTTMVLHEIPLFETEQGKHCE
jgi:hypothetical protein